MTDKEKLEAIRAEIHRLVDVRGYDKEMANDLFAFMDSLPNEPVSEEWIEELSTKLDSLSKEDFKKVFDKYAIDFNEEPVSEEFKREVNEYFWKEICNNKDIVLHPDYLFMIARHFANWQKQQLMKDAVECEVIGEGTGWLSFGYVPECEYDSVNCNKVKLIIINKRYG